MQFDEILGLFSDVTKSVFFMIPENFEISEFPEEDYTFMQNFKQKVMDIKIPNHSMKRIEDEFDSYIIRMQSKLSGYRYR